MKYLIILLALAGCASKPVVNPLADVVLVPKDDKVSVPDVDLSLCPPLEKFEVKALSQQDTIDMTSKFIDTYTACRVKQKLLADAIRKAFNIPEVTKQIEPSK